MKLTEIEDGTWVDLSAVVVMVEQPGNGTHLSFRGGSYATTSKSPLEILAMMPSASADLGSYFTRKQEELASKVFGTTISYLLEKPPKGSESTPSS